MTSSWDAVCFYLVLYDLLFFYIAMPCFVLDFICIMFHLWHITFFIAKIESKRLISGFPISGLH